MRRAWRDQLGAAAMQYSLAAGIVGLGVVASLTGTKTTLSRVYQRLALGLTQATDNPLYGSVFEQKGTGTKTYNQYVVNGRVQWENDIVTFPDGSTASRMRTFNADGSDPGNTLIGAYSYGMTDQKTGLSYGFQTSSTGAISQVTRQATTAVDGFNGTINYTPGSATMTAIYASGGSGQIAVSQVIQNIMSNSDADRQYINNQVMKGGFTAAQAPSSAM